MATLLLWRRSNGVALLYLLPTAFRWLMRWSLSPANLFLPLIGVGALAFALLQSVVLLLLSILLPAVLRLLCPNDAKTLAPHPLHRQCCVCIAGAEAGVARSTIRSTSIQQHFQTEFSVASVGCIAWIVVPC